MQERFLRSELLLGTAAMEILSHSRVAVFGIGGVGSFAVEALARSGVGAIDLIDYDVVSLTNINRQLIALSSTIGLPKTEVMAKRIIDINPSCCVIQHTCFYLPHTADQIDLAQFDYIIDAVDTVTAKLLIATRAQMANTPLISCMGTANKLDPAALRVADISETSICPLAKIIRKECRKRGIEKLKVVYSEEPARQPSEETQTLYQEALHYAQAQESKTIGRAGIPGSVVFVPPVAGLLLASEVVRDLTAKCKI